jgi:hypothetical protein
VARTRIDDLSVMISADASALAADLRGATRHLEDFRKAAARDADLGAGRAAARALGDVRKAAAEAGGSLREMAGSAALFAAKVAAGAGALAAVGAGLDGLRGVMDQVKTSVSMAAEFEQNQIAFETMLGSAEKAARLLGDMRKFAADTPFAAKDITEAARQLVAYGFAADDVIPSLKVIGTLAAVAGKPIGELTYNVGTTRVQGRATQADINQLAGKGVDVYPGLARVLGADVAEVRKRVEDGRVGWDEYRLALEDLARTRYAGLLEKQSNALKGSWEQLGDAFDRAKLKLGQVLAQELGLRGMGRDLEGFAGRIERAFDSSDFRGFVRLVGDGARGVAQLAYEFGRAGLAVAEINLEGLARVSPQLAAAGKAARELVAGLGDFRLDKRAVAEFGLELFKAIAFPVADAVDAIEDGFKRVKKFIEENVTKPLEKARGIWGEIQFANREPGQWLFDNLAGPEQKEWARRKREQMGAEEVLRLRGYGVPRGTDPGTMARMNAVLDAAGDPGRFAPPSRLEDPKDIARRYQELYRAISAAQTLEFRKAGGPGGLFPDVAQRRQELQKLWAEFHKPFAFRDRMQVGPGDNLLDNTPATVFDPSNEAEWFWAKGPSAVWNATLEPRHWRSDWQGGGPGPRPDPKTRLERLQRATEDFEKEFWRHMLTEDVRAGFGRLYGSMGKARDLGRAVAGPFGLGPALGPLSGLAPLLGEVRKDQYLPGSGGPPAHLVELAGKLNDQFTARGLEKQLAELDDTFKRGLIGRDVLERARRDAVAGTADRLGAGGPARLPDALLQGSAEAVRVMNQWRAGGGGMTTEDLLKAILETLKQQNGLVDAGNAVARGAAAVVGLAP